MQKQAIKKGGPGRPEKPKEQKRRAVLMLRLNKIEEERLKKLIRDRAWIGDRASFVRHLVTATRRKNGPGINLRKLEEAVSALSVMIDDLPMDDKDRAQAADLMDHFSGILFSSK